MSTVNYRFEQANDSDYNLKLTYFADSEYVRQIMRLVKRKLKKKREFKQDVSGTDYKMVEVFEIPEEEKDKYVPVLKRAIRKEVKRVYAEVINDKIHILNYYVKGAVYRLVGGEDWEIDIFVGGQFVKK